MFLEPEVLGAVLFIIFIICWWFGLCDYHLGSYFRDDIVSMPSTTRTNFSAYGQPVHRQPTRTTAPPIRRRTLPPPPPPPSRSVPTVRVPARPLDASITLVEDERPVGEQPKETTGADTSSSSTVSKKLLALAREHSGVEKLGSQFSHPNTSNISSLTAEIVALMIIEKPLNFLPGASLPRQFSQLALITSYSQSVQTSILSFDNEEARPFPQL